MRQIKPNKRTGESRYYQSMVLDYPQGRDIRRFSPEQMLVSELLKREVMIACRARDKNVSPEAALETHDSYRWICETDQDAMWPFFTFEACCHHLNLDPEFIRDGVRKVRAGQARLRTGRMIRFANPMVAA